MRSSYRPSRPGFTLIELLVVIAIITLLVAMLVPALQKAREIARRAVCQVQTKSLCIADNLYHQDWRCYSPLGWGPNYSDTNYEVLFYWYQKQMMGKYFNENVPMYGPSNAPWPPQNSVLRCPSKAVWAGMKPEDSWIAYNAAMSYQYGDMGRAGNHKPFWRGPRQEEIKVPLSNFVLFADGRGSSFYYMTNWAYNDPQGWNADVSQSSGTCDFRHLGGGINYGFADTHVQWFQDPDDALFRHQIYRFANSGGAGFPPG